MKALGKKLKTKARLLRRRGLSYNEIGVQLKIAKSTVRQWCMDIVLKSEQVDKLYKKQIESMSKSFNSSHARRQREIKVVIENAEKEIRLPLSREAYLLMGAALYWGEGSKTLDFCVTNSDPFLVKFAVCWMRDILDLKTDELTAHLNIYEGQDEKEIKEFWFNLTGIPVENFGKSFIKPQSTGYRKNNLYHGTIKIRAKKGSDIRLRISGWINSVLKDERINIDTRLIWSKHKE